MKVAILNSPKLISLRPLVTKDISQPNPRPGDLLLQVRVCGVCRTDLHLVEESFPSFAVPSFLVTRS